MADEALAAAYPKERGEIDFFAVRFSRDGEFLALVLENIQIGDPEQVWLYEMRSRRLAPVTKPHELLRIRDLAWSKDGTLYISVWRFGDGNVAQPFFLAATMAETRQIEKPPAEIIGIFNQSSKMRHFSVTCCEERNDRYTVTVTSGGNGYRTLSMKRTASKEWPEIVHGGFELETFLIDPVRMQVLYPALGEVIAFDLRTLRHRPVLDLKNPVFPFLLDRTEDGTVAYAEPGACLGEAPPISQGGTRKPRHVCFVKLQ
jgi:hypothetical protein